MNTLKILIIISSVLILNNCDRNNESNPNKQGAESTAGYAKSHPGPFDFLKREPEKSISVSESTLGIYNSSYDRTKWAETTLTDGRKMLKHKIVQECYVGYNSEPMGYEEPDFHGFSISTKVKTFEGSNYDVLTIRQKDKIHCITYSKQSSKNAFDFSVYTRVSSGQCVKEAESIISSYEKYLREDK